MDGESLFLEKENCMVYQITINESQQQLVFFPVSKHDYMGIMQELNKIAVPVLYYLRGLYYSFNQYNRITKNDTDQIFTEHREYWQSLMASRMIESEAPINVVVVDPGPQRNHLSQIYRMVCNLALCDAGIDILTYLHHERIVLLIPGRYRLKMKPETRHGIDLNSHLESLYAAFGKGIVFAVSQTVTYGTMFDGYREALAELFYREYFRKDTGLLFWDALGPAVHTIKTAQSEIEPPQWIHTLTRYENERSGNLLSTLRELVRSQFYYQAASQKLHIHLNTLYYRQEKLSEILEMDFAELETKIILYEKMFAVDFAEYFQKEM